MTEENTISGLSNFNNVSQNLNEYNLINMKIFSGCNCNMSGQEKPIKRNEI